MKDKILTVLLYIFAFLFLIYPTSYGISDLKIVVIFVTILLLLLFIYKKSKILKKIHIKEKYFPWIILLLAIITRIGIVLLFENHLVQVSDFGGALNASNIMDFSSDYYRIFTHWILYPTMVHGIYQIFGSSQLVALLTNAIILIISSLLVYKVSFLIFNNKTYGFISSLFYILWPSNILYTLIFSQEHFCLLLLLLILWLFLITEKSDKITLNKKKIISFILIGISLGLSTFFKNFAPAFIIAFIIYYFLKGFKQEYLKTYILNNLGAVMIILISMLISKNLIFMEIDHIAGHEVARNITPCYLNVGLNGDGRYNAELYGEYYTAIRENNYDYDKANEEIIKLLKNRLFSKDSTLLDPNFFDNKATIIFGNDNSKITWVINSINAKEYIDASNILEDTIKPINNDYFIILVTLMAFGLVSIRNSNLKKFLLYLILFGSLLLLILVEAQNRYMYAVQPIICILATGGLFDLIKYWEVKNEKIPKTNKSKALD